MTQEEPKKEQAEEIPTWGTPAAERLVDGVMKNLCGAANRGDVVSKLVKDGRIRMPDEAKSHMPVRNKDEVPRR